MNNIDYKYYLNIVVSIYKYNSLFLSYVSNVSMKIDSTFQYLFMIFYLINHMS